MAAKQKEQEQAQEGSGEVFALPPGHENQTVGFARAYAHAKKHGNPDKSALLYAEAWAFDFEPTDEEDQ